VLDGEATFYDKEGAATVLTKGKGILLPKGWYYRFHNTGGKPLILPRLEPIKIRPPSTEQELKVNRSRLDRAKTILSSRSRSKAVIGRCKHFVEQVSRKG
jgi:oxalate decarboxylase/phosphoglucose isomerase-like protein (cupin superfamily)